MLSILPHLSQKLRCSAFDTKCLGKCDHALKVPRPLNGFDDQSAIAKTLVLFTHMAKGVFVG